MSDTKPRVAHQGKMGPVSTAMPIKDNANGTSGPSASKIECGYGSPSAGTAGRKTWPSLAK